MSIMKKLAIMISIVGIYAFYVYFLREGEVHKIYQEKSYSQIWKKQCKSTVVLVENAPLSHYAQRKLWLRTKTDILEKWAPLEEHCDSLLYLNNRPERAYDAGDNNYWVGDFQYCLNGAFGEYKCISKEEQLFSVKMWGLGDTEVAGQINGKPMYLNFIDY